MKVTTHQAWNLRSAHRIIDWVTLDFIDRGDGTKLHQLKLLDLSKLLFLSSMYSMKFLLLFQMSIHKIMPGSSVLRQQAGPEMIALK
jgi:hypothetical protein